MPRPEDGTGDPAADAAAGPPDAGGGSDGGVQALTERTVSRDPFVQFGAWFEDAARSVRAPEAVAVATASASGAPSVRMVLMKGWDERGLVFHTNYGSRKGREIAENPRAALLFHWDPLGRQVRVEGEVERIAEAESDAHFETRQRGARVGARASWQSRPIASREELDRRVREVAERYDGRDVPRPPWWGGYRVRPDSFEFWQRREDRLHDRIRYERTGGAWRIERLQP